MKLAATFLSLFAGVAYAQPSEPEPTPSTEPVVAEQDLAPQRAEEPSNIPDVHNVVTGDTLWDISGYYYSDPWRWPKVWALNPQIKDAHWIYPGDIVRLLPGEPGDGTRVADAKPDAKPLIAPTTSAAAMRAETLAAPQRLAVKALAFAEKSSIDRAARIDGSAAEKELLTLGDRVYLAYSSSNPPQVGKRYAIFRVERPVVHEGNTLGSYVRMLGELEVTSQMDKRRASAIITGARNEIERGALVAPVASEFRVGPAVAAAADVDATIVSLMRKAELIGQGEIVMLNVGVRSGLKVGNRMTVIRRGDAFLPIAGPATAVGQNDTRYPARPLGVIAIVDVGEHMSVGVVLNGTQEVGVGDRVIMQQQ